MKFFTDGSCSGNPGPGGWGVVAVNNNDEVIWCYGEQEEQTTNNRMELTAIEYVLYRYGARAGTDDEIPDVYTDSAYALGVVTSWMFTWAQNDWIKSDKKVPENLDIIRPIYNYWQKGYRIKLHKIKGHAGCQFNELADQIAKGEKIDF